MTNAILPIEYVPGFVEFPDAALAALLNELEWERRGDTPRSEYYCNDAPDPYEYGRGRGRRLYEPRPWHMAILDMRTRLESRVGAVMDVCFLNKYLDQTDHLGWHADDSPEMDGARPIGIISLGVERDVWFRPRGSKVDADITRLRLGHGSLCVMAPGMQDAWDHRIPKASFACGQRVSLTFRGYVRP